MLTWSPIGNDRAAEITWSVVVVVPLCSGGPPKRTGVRAINWGADYSIDEHGNTTRVLRGYIEIVQRGGGRTSLDTADRYRQKFSPGALSGFRRSQTWTLSPDRRRVDFNIRDEQIASPNPYPLNITAISGTHRFQWRRPSGRDGNFRVNSIGLDITPEAGLSGAQAYAVFVGIVRQRIEAAKRRKMSPFLLSVDIEESLFSRTHSFQATYKLMRPIQDFLLDSGMFRPLGTNWERWATSLQTSAFSPYGHAGLRDVAANDVIVSLCESTDTIYPNNLAYVAPEGQGMVLGTVTNEKPDRKASFLSYENVIMPTAEHSVTQQRVIQTPGTDSNYWGSENTIPPEFFSTDTPSAERSQDVLHEGAVPSWLVRMAGKAQRAGYPIPRIKLESVGTQTLKNGKLKTIAQRFLQRSLGNLFGVPVYEGAWVVDYALAEPPGQISVPTKLDEE